MAMMMIAAHRLEDYDLLTVFPLWVGFAFITRATAAMPPGWASCTATVTQQQVKILVLLEFSCHHTRSISPEPQSHNNPTTPGTTYWVPKMRGWGDKRKTFLLTNFAFFCVPSELLLEQQNCILRQLKWPLMLHKKLIILHKNGTYKKYILLTKLFYTQ